jgi:hypothetical protein
MTTHSPFFPWRCDHATVPWTSAYQPTKGAAMPVNNRGGKSNKRTRSASPYVGWFSASELKRERERLSKQEHVSDVIDVWRQQRIHMIDQRLYELYNTRE